MSKHYGPLLAAAAALSALASPVSAIAASRHSDSGASVARDGPFGIAMGEPLTDVGPTKDEDNDSLYQLLAVPRPSPVFTWVGVQAFPSTGVCLIQAAKDPVDYDNTGERIKASVDDVAALVATKYGAFAKKVDDCSALPVECSTFWSLKASEGSATYEYLWDLRDSKRADGIGIITVSAIFTSSARAYATVRYFGQNQAACDAASKASRAAGL